LGLKIILAVSWFDPQNQVGDGLLVTLQNWWEEDGAGHTSRSNSLFRLESRVRVFQFTSKLWEEQRWVVHVAASWRPCEDEAEDRRVDAMGCIEFFYPYFTVFIVLDTMGILVFWMSI
jgi:hypothetical protein